MVKEKSKKNIEFEKAERDLPKVLLMKFRAEEKYRHMIFRIKRQNDIQREIRLRNR